VPVGTPLKVEVRRGARAFPLALVAVRPPRGLGLAVLEDALGLTVTSGARGPIVEGVTRGSLAERAGLEPGDRLLAANGQRLEGTEQLGHEVLRGLDRGSLLLVVGRGRYAYNLNFPL
jgi:serine protease Do